MNDVDAVNERSAEDGASDAGGAPRHSIRVVIADDHPLFRDGVARSLSEEPDVCIVGEGASSAEAVRLVRDLLPDVALLDVTMPGGGLAAAQAIAASCPATQIAMLTVSEHEDDVTAALKAGARGYILKGVSARELACIVRALASGEGYISPTLAASLLAQLARPEAASGPEPAASGPLDGLSEREHEILEHVAAGQSNKEIAYLLHLSEKTVKHYMTNILQKLQVRNRVEAALLAQSALGQGGH